MAFAATQYTITAARTVGEAQHAPKDWTLYGSNDDSNWDPLDVVSGADAWGALTKRTYDIDSPAEYRYYKLNVTAVQGGWLVSISQIELLVGGVDVVPTLSTYTHAPSWTVTYSNDNNGSDTCAAWRAFDDVVDDVDRWLTATEPPQWIKVDSGLTVAVPALDGTLDIPIPSVAAGANVTVPALGGTLDIPVPSVTSGVTIPTTTSLTPTSKIAGEAGFTLTVNGTSFVNGSVVKWDNSNRTTTYVSATQLTATITAADIASAGTASVTVFNPEPGGGTSNAQTLTINSVPVPTTTTISPTSKIAGRVAFTLTVNGTNFASGLSVVQWNGSARTTTYVSGTQLTAAIPAADIAEAGTVSVTVFNPAPGGGTSNAQTFTINNLVVVTPMSSGIARVIWPKLIIEVHDVTGSIKYQDIGPDINSLRFSSKDGVGYDTCTFPIVRDVRFSYPDLSIGNKIKLSAGDRVAWEGLINSVNIQAEEDTGIEVTCFGYFALLTKRINTTPLTTGMKGSDWILANLIADTDLEFETGNIYTDDYVFPADLDLGDDLYYNTILTKINEYNGFIMGVGADRKFDFYPKPSMISYKVRMEDCHTSLIYERDSITNYVLVQYTTDGTTYHTFWWPDDGPDQASYKLYGRCDGILVIEEYCTEAMAQQKAEVALEAGTTMRPASDLTLERIYDVNTGVEADIRLIKPGSLVFIEDLASVQTSVNDAATLNEMSTFAIAETEFDVESEGGAKASYAKE